MALVTGPLGTPSDSDDYGYDEWLGKLWLVYKPILEQGACFYCGRDLSYPLFYWVADTTLVLHSLCAFKIAHKILNDVGDFPFDESFHPE